MEIANEIKAKVFAQYFGHKIMFNRATHWNVLSGGHLFMDNDFKLILKPLSEITNEDAIEVAKLQQEFKQQKGIKVDFHIDDKNNGCLDCIIQWDGYTHDYYQPVYSPTFQYLQSKGYDLPQYLLGGKTLQEVGLAIYE